MGYCVKYKALFFHLVPFDVCSKKFYISTCVQFLVLSFQKLIYYFLGLISSNGNFSDDFLLDTPNTTI